MKKYLALIISVVMVFSLFGCTKETATEKQLEALLGAQPLCVKSVKYTVQSPDNKSEYPDILQAVVINNGQDVVESATVLFVAWDESKNPVKIQGKEESDEGEYIKAVSFPRMDLAPGETYGQESGVEISENSGINYFKAIVQSYVTADGKEHKNPYADEWKKMYEGEPYSQDLTVSVKLEKGDSLENTVDMYDEDADTLFNFDRKLSEDEVRVESTNYLVQDEKDKSKYPDMLQAVIANESETKISDVVVAFVAWDESGNPVRIKSVTDSSDGNYVTEVTFKDIKLAPGKTFGEGAGLQIVEAPQITTIEAIVVSYKGYEGENWENPLYSQWKYCYGGAKIMM